MSSKGAGVSIEVVRNEIARFLKSTDAEVRCLKGKWGVGKTFAWDRYIKQLKGEIGLERYAYVSLYGVSSVDRLRLSIVENTIKREQIGQEFDPQSMLANLGGSAESIFSRISQVVMGKDRAALFEQALFLTVRKQVVCIDDLERKGDALKIKEVLGLASFLKEQRKCKVVLILNDGAFENDEKDDFKTFFEKTVDSHVTFAPTAEECAQIALPDASGLQGMLRAHCITLGISNIRVIGRIERMARLLELMLGELNAQVLQDYVRDLVVLGWCKYGEEAPPLEFAKKRRSPTYTGAKEQSDDEKKWGELLDRYGLRYFSTTSAAVLEGIEQGFFDPAVVLPGAQKLHDGYVAQQSEADFHNAWQIYHRGFGDDENELVEKFNTSFRKNVQYISPMNANGTVGLLKDLGHAAVATELINLYVASRDASTFDRRNMFRENDISDEEFDAAVKAKIAGIVDDRDPKEVLLKITRNRSWDKPDILLLSKLNADQYVKLFKSIEDSDELSAAIQMARSFAGFGNASDEDKAISQNATEALIKIGKKSNLNKRRVVSKYGIKFE